MDKTLFSVIKGNIECAFCKEPNCPLRYQPHHRMVIEGTRLTCKKVYEKRMKKVLNSKLP